MVRLACAEASDRRLRLCVSDTGPGIAPQLLPRVFMPFERLGAEQTEVEGSGLGLALSKRLVEAMGGTVGVESRLGEGSTFWVELPMMESPIQRIQRLGEIEQAAKARGPVRTILYVEDNLSNLRLLEQILTRRPDIKLLTAMQGRLSLDLAREHHPDLILLDMNLPDMPGDQVLRWLQGEPRTRDIPVVILSSADTSPKEIERLLAGGARAYLAKPIHVNEFLSVVDEVLGGQVVG